MFIFKKKIKTIYFYYFIDLADEFLAIYEKCPDRIKKKLVYQNERVSYLYTE